MTSFNDIFKSSFLEKTSSFSAVDMVIALVLAFGVGLFIYFVYKRTYRGVMYSQSFGVSLIALTMIATFVILAVTSNVVLSLGMVGALSIVRFRTAIKEPLDIAYLFWAIAVGIVLGAGLIPLALFGSIMIGIILTLFVNKKSGETPYLLVLQLSSDAAEQKAVETVKAQAGRSSVKAKRVNKDGIELTLEIRLKQGATQFVNEVCALEGVDNAALVTYNGEYMA